MEAVSAETCPVTDEQAGEIMAEMQARMGGSPMTQEQRAARRAAKRRAAGPFVEDAKEEIAKRVQMAATEYFMMLGTAQQVSISQLQRKH